MGGYGSDAADYSGYTLLNGKLYFSALQASTGYELWVTDGTTAGTTIVKDILAGPGSSDAAFSGLYPYNGKLYFPASDSVNGSQLWSSDGTSAGTSLVKVLSPYKYYASPQHFIDYNGKLIFVAATDSTNLNQLYVSDGTSGGTQVLSPPIAGNANPLGSNPNFCLSNGSLYLAANFNSIGAELWVYGFPLGITPVAGLQTISASPNPFSTSITLSGLESAASYTVQLIDMTGREFYTITVDHPSASTSLDMPQLTAGIYLMQVSGHGTTQTFKLVKN